MADPAHPDRPRGDDPADGAEQRTALQPRRIAGLCVLAFTVMASYAIARPTSESLFISEHGSKALPGVWIMVAIAAVVVVGIYNRFSPGVEILRVLVVASLASAAVLAVVLTARANRLTGATYALYVWKDVYIVVLVELFWTFANTLFPIQTARWIYGLFCVMGALGGITANLLVGPVSESIGTGAAAWLALPVLVLVALEIWVFQKTAAPPSIKKNQKESAAFWQGAKVVASSRYLIAMLLMIGTVQVVITLVDYQYSAMLESSFPNTDERTLVIGRVYAVIDGGSMALQLFSGVILRLLGVPMTLLGIPMILAASLLAFAISPRFLVMAVTKVCSKAFDYSLFRVAKEILYIPLDYDEKTQGKAVVDILTYRVAKGGASLLLLVLVAVESGRAVTLLTLGLSCLWFTWTLLAVRRYRARVPREVELAGQKQSS